MEQFVVLGAWGFAGVAVAVDTLGRFNNPPTNRFSTTQVAYRLAAALYSVTVLGLWVAAALLLLRPSVLPAAPIAAALIVVELRRLPFLERLDSWLLDAFRRRAAIPAEVLRLATDMMREESYKIPPSLMHRLRSRLGDQGLDPNDPRFEKQGSTHHAWRQLTAFMETLADYQTEPRLMNVTTPLHDRFTGTFERYRGLAEQATARLEDTCTDCRTSFESSIRSLSQDACDLLASCVLHRSATARAEQRVLDELGFTVSGRPRIDLDHILTVALLLFPMIVLGFFGPWAHQTGYRKFILGASGFRVDPS